MLFLPDLQTWEELTNIGTFGSGSKEWQDLDSAYKFFITNVENPLAKQKCVEALDAFFDLKKKQGKKSERDSKGALSALRRTLKEEYRVLTPDDRIGLIEYRKAELTAVFRIFNKVSIHLKEEQKTEDKKELVKAVKECKDAIVALKKNKEDNPPSAAELMQHKENMLNSYRTGCQTLGIQPGGSIDVVNSVMTPEVFQMIAEALPFVGPATEGAKILNNIRLIVTNQVNKSRSRDFRHLAGHNSMQSAIDSLIQMMDEHNIDLAKDMGKSAFKIVAGVVMPAGGQNVINFGEAVAGLFFLAMEIMERNSKITRVNNKLATIVKVEDFQELMLEWPVLAAHFIVTVDDNTFVNYTLGDINQPFFMILFERNKAKIEHLRAVSRVYIGKSEYAIRNIEAVNQRVEQLREEEKRNFVAQAYDINKQHREIEIAAFKELKQYVKEAYEAYDAATYSNLSTFERLYRMASDRKIQIRSDASLKAVEGLKRATNQQMPTYDELMIVVNIVRFLIDVPRYDNPPPGYTNLEKLNKGGRFDTMLSERYNFWVKNWKDKIQISD